MERGCLSVERSLQVGGSKEKADTPGSNGSDWSQYQFLASTDKPLVVANPQRRLDDDQDHHLHDHDGWSRQSLVGTGAPMDGRILKGAMMAMAFSVRLLVSLLADVWSSSHLGDNRDNERAGGTSRRERRNTKMKEWSILTPINQTAVVLLVGFGSVSFSNEGNIGDSLRAASRIVMKSDILKGSNGRVEQFLPRNR